MPAEPPGRGRVAAARASPEQSRGHGATDLNLQGRRILVAEDELLAAFRLEDLLRATGAAVVGPVPSIELALAWAGGLDGAVLDVNLNGHRVTPVAEAFAAQGVPFVLVSGYGRADLPEPVLRRAPLVGKAAAAADLARAMAGAFG